LKDLNRVRKLLKLSKEKLFQLLLKPKIGIEMAEELGILLFIKKYLLLVIHLEILSLQE
jgi:hypothetical protein